MKITSGIAFLVACFCAAFFSACVGIRPEMKALERACRSQIVIERFIRSGMLFDDTGTWFTEFEMRVNGRTECFVLFVSGKVISLDFGKLSVTGRQGFKIVPCSVEAVSLSKAFEKSIPDLGHLEANNARMIVGALLGDPYPPGITWRHFGQKYRE